MGNIELIENTLTLIQGMNVQLCHIFKERNQLADSLINSVINQAGIQQFWNFSQMPSQSRLICNMDKYQISSLRIKTKQILDISSYVHEQDIYRMQLIYNKLYIARSVTMYRFFTKITVITLRVSECVRKRLCKKVTVHPSKEGKDIGITTKRPQQHKPHCASSVSKNP